MLDIAWESPPPLWLSDDLLDTSQQVPLCGELGQTALPSRIKESASLVEKQLGDDHSSPYYDTALFVFPRPLRPVKGNMDIEKRRGGPLTVHTGAKLSSLWQTAYLFCKPSCPIPASCDSY